MFEPKLDLVHDFLPAGRKIFLPTSQLLTQHTP
jgi:hypothetical protein